MTDFIISFNFSCQKGTLVFETAYFDQESDKTSTGLVNITHILEEEKSSKHLSVSESFYVKIFFYLTAQCTRFPREIHH